VRMYMTLEFAMLGFASLGVEWPLGLKAAWALCSSWVNVSGGLVA